VRNSALAILLAFSVFPFSSSRAGPHIVTSYGAGLRSCGSLLEAFEIRPKPDAVEIDGEPYESRSAVYEQWILGFVSGYNTANERSRNVEVVDTTGITAWIRRWCSDHPTKQVMEATMKFMFEESRLPQPPKK
jgi:hypothetical protein